MIHTQWGWREMEPYDDFVPLGFTVLSTSVPTSGKYSPNNKKTRS